MGGYCLVQVFQDKGSTGGLLLFPEFKIGLQICNHGFAVFQAWKYIHANSAVSNININKEKERQSKKGKELIVLEYMVVNVTLLH